MLDLCVLHLICKVIFKSYMNVNHNLTTYERDIKEKQQNGKGKKKKGVINHAGPKAQCSAQLVSQPTRVASPIGGNRQPALSR